MNESQLFKKCLLASYLFLASLFLTFYFLVPLPERERIKERLISISLFAEKPKPPPLPRARVEKVEVKEVEKLAEPVEKKEEKKVERPKKKELVFTHLPQSRQEQISPLAKQQVDFQVAKSEVTKSTATAPPIISAPKEERKGEISSSSKPELTLKIQPGAATGHGKEKAKLALPPTGGEVSRKGKEPPGPISSGVSSLTGEDLGKATSGELQKAVSSILQELIAYMKKVETPPFSQVVNSYLGGNGSLQDQFVSKEGVKLFLQYREENKELKICLVFQDGSLILLVDSGLIEQSFYLAKGSAILSQGKVSSLISSQGRPNENETKKFYQILLSWFLEEVKPKLGRQK